eukprot:CAMPEP_0177743824 /NCGR_PEP_ID=MMETSP0484_2-20121128/29401_1 /TAXON_ID=354590 /ORGANISM="Rhodomonas lens, Strain RHODO" /LENGTH=206 /DNA_ID=CAMNT_0019258251 /DNA_START=188 /DNA_END=810 /DNA_ORIENTATION=+
MTRMPFFSIPILVPSSRWVLRLAQPSRARASGLVSASRHASHSEASRRAAGPAALSPSRHSQARAALRDRLRKHLQLAGAMAHAFAPARMSACPASPAESTAVEARANVGDDKLWIGSVLVEHYYLSAPRSHPRFSGVCADDGVCWRVGHGASPMGLVAQQRPHDLLVSGVGHLQRPAVVRQALLLAHPSACNPTQDQLPLCISLP